MSKIIKIKSHYQKTAAYKKSLKLAIEKLDEIETELTGLSISIATSGKWKEWSDGMPDGSTFAFTPTMLKDTGDDNVNIIASLADEVINVREKIKQQIPAK